MLTIEEKIARSRKKTKQLEIQKKLKDKRDQDAQRKSDTRRHTIIGRLVSKHFPDVSQFQPYRSEAENEIEFALLDAILSLLVSFNTSHS